MSSLRPAVREDIREDIRESEESFSGGDTVLPFRSVAASLWAPAQLSGTTVTGESSILRLKNRSGTTLTSITLDYANFYVQTNGDVLTDLGTPTIHAAIGYPLETDVHMAIDGVSMAPGEFISGEASGFSIPDGEEFFLLQDVHGNGGRYADAYLGAGTISTNDLKRQPYISPTAPSRKATLGIALSSPDSGRILLPVGVRARHRGNIAVTAIGDSWVQGSGDGLISGDVSTGIFGRACTGLYPYTSYGFAGAELRNNVSAASLQYRLRVFRENFSHVIIEYGINDVVAAGMNLATLQSNYLELANLIAAEGPKVIGSTIGCRCSSSDTFDTVANQTPSTAYVADTLGNTGSNSTIVNEFNDWLRLVPSPLYDVFDMADALMSSHNSLRWGINAAWTNPSYTNDGVHPSVSNVSLAQGGVYPARDALITKLAQWAAAD